MEITIQYSECSRENLERNLKATNSFLMKRVVMIGVRRHGNLGLEGRPHSTADFARSSAHKRTSAKFKLTVNAKTGE